MQKDNDNDRRHVNGLVCNVHPAHASHVEDALENTVQILRVVTQLENLSKLPDILSAQQQMLDRLVAPATNEGRMPVKTANTIFTVLGGVIFTLLGILVFLLTGEMSGVIGNLHR